ncbi:cell division protein FtsQ/DivIB [uncultured Bacteroides sp.]|uniref:cell division protein FtsQ/DivIB n=1 Tax=uncultured Bacteroides sp. TaxID=162156 RepID=UPI002AABC2B7|nr:cell division protein FtsQ/DivIB [uncultured Bacteroides sp.]
MIKKILLLFALLLIIAYLAVAITALNKEPLNAVCNDIELIIKDTTNENFITKQEIGALLKSKGLYPVQEKMERIKTKKLEKELAKHPLIEKAECYKTPSNKLCIEITQRVPILKVMSNNGDEYYLDNKGRIIPPGAKCIAHLAVVTGNVEKSFAMRYLHKFGVFLHQNKFWNAQIEQINVLPEKDIELVPRVGNHTIYLGKIDNFEEKLSRLKVFYKKALNQVGWNKYSRINLEFNNQIICTKNKKTLHSQ